jgi:hypothetical protein
MSNEKIVIGPGWELLEMMKRTLLAIAAIVTAGITSAQAGPATLSFGAENGGVAQLNYYGLANYNVSQGSVDLIGNGYFDAYTGNGLYVDLAGSTGQFGALTTKAIFAPGTYNVSLSLGGPIYNGITDGANVSWGQGPGLDFTLTGLTIADYAFSVTLLNPEAFTISDLGLSGNGNIGSTLFGFNVSPAERVSIDRVPEPVTMSLFGAGLVGAFAARRRRKSKD